MPRSAQRFVLLAPAALALVSDSAGVLLTLHAGREPSSWQLTALGVGLPAAALGLLVAWHRPQNRISWLFLAASSGFGLSQLGLGVLAQPGTPGWEAAGAYFVLLILPGPLTVAWVLLILTFPDGRLHGSASRRFAAVATAVAVGASCLELAVAPAGYLPQQFGASAPSWLSGPLSVPLPPFWKLLELPDLLLPAVAVLALIARYRSASITLRQQIKWLGLAVVVVVVVDAVFGVAGAFGIKEPWFVTLAVAPLPTTGAALAIFKYRLWEIDRLLSRTLAFAALWAATSAGFIALAALVGLVVAGLDLHVLAAVTIALVVVLALQPLRGRLENGISRLIYGPRPRGYMAVARLADAAPGAIALGQLADLVASVTRDAVGARWASVWLRVQVDGRSLLKPVAWAGATPVAAPILLEGGESGVAESLERALSESPSKVVPLVAADETVGLLAFALGAAAEPGEDDDEVLALIAHQAALLLRSGRLEEELRERLEELRESRQRLVSAQDAERRRLERDLHDGVQQQLVALAVRLKRSSRLGAAAAELESMAAEAEEAVFAMQELARGIYPSVLVDSGVPAALRAQAARVPLDVRLEVDPALAGARFAPDVEACLYFVAMEAMTNCQKHARTAAVTVSLRREEPAGRLVLEVHDGGRGFDARSVHGGAGLQNMRDRLAALGGELSVRSRPGAGTWVTATLPVPADVIELQRAERVSRR